MRTISILNLKGGVGKTITTVNLGYNLARKGYRVLLIDNDKQGNLSQFFEVPLDKAEGVSKLLSEDYYNPEIIYHTKELDIVPTCLSVMTAVKRLESDAGIILKHDKIKTYLETVKDNYDFCLIDNPPDLGITVVNALFACDDVIVPIKIDEFSFMGLSVLEEQVNNVRQINPTLNFAGCLVTMFQKNKLNANGIQWLKEKTPYGVFNATIRNTVTVSRSIENHLPLTAYAPKEPVTQDYMDFTEEYLGGLQNDL